MLAVEMLIVGSAKLQQKREKTTLCIAHLKKTPYLCTRQKPNRCLWRCFFDQGKMPEWSIGAVSKTVNPLRDSRVRIPVFPPAEAPLQEPPFYFMAYPIGAIMAYPLGGKTACNLGGKTAEHCTPANAPPPSLGAQRPSGAAERRPAGLWSEGQRGCGAEASVAGERRPAWLWSR